MKTAIVLGGGVLGSALFRELSRRGISTRLVDPPEVGSSDGSFAWINAAARTDPAYYALRMQGMVRHLIYSVPRSLAGFGGVLSWDGEGQIEPVQGSTQAETVDNAHRRLVDIGHHTELLDRDDALAIDHSLNPAALPESGIQYSGDEGWVDLPGLVTQLRGDGVSAGGVVLPGTSGRVSLNSAGDHVDRVVLSDGQTISADLVIVAAGADTYSLLGEAGVAIPDDNSVGMIVRSKPVDGLAPTAIVRSPHICVRPETQRALAFHATGAETELKFPAEVNDGPIDEASQRMLEDVRFLYNTTAIEIDRVDVVRRPVPGDGLPVVGAVPRFENLYALASHSGATVSLILAELLGREISTGKQSILLSGFRPGRFQMS